jgi:hypothetical protein
MLTSNITSDLPPRSEDPHDHTTHETIRRENLAVATSVYIPWTLIRPFITVNHGVPNASKNAVWPRRRGTALFLVWLEGLHSYLRGKRKDIS